MSDTAIPDLIIQLRDTEKRYMEQRAAFDALPVPAWDAVPKEYKALEWDLRRMDDQMTGLRQDLVAAIMERFDTLSDEGVRRWWER